MSLRSKVFAAMLLLVVAGDAMATQYYYCFIRDYYGKELLFYSGIMSTAESIDEQQTAFAYGDEIKDQVGYGSTVQSCTSSSNLGYVKEHWGRLPESYPSPNPRMIPFTHPPVPSKPVEESPPGALLTLKSDPGPTPKELAERAEKLRQAEAEQAAKRAQFAAEAARIDAESKARVEAEMKRRRLCPRCI